MQRSQRHNGPAEHGLKMADAHTGGDSHRMNFATRDQTRMIYFSAPTHFSTRSERGIPWP